MKKFLLALFAVATIFCSCQKDTATNVSIISSDLISINSQLKGTWVFPVQTLSIVDNTGQNLSPVQQMPMPAFQFDGSTKVNIMPDQRTVLKGTYELTTKNGFIYLDVEYPDKTSLSFQVLLVNSQVLKLTSSQPYAYGAADKPIQATAVTSTQFKRQSSADVTGSFVTVSAISDSLFNVGVYVTHAIGGAPTLLNSRENATGAYNYSFPAKHGDQLTIDLLGSLTSSSFYAYYKGIPLSGDVRKVSGEMKTGTGWTIP